MPTMVPQPKSVPLYIYGIFLQWVVPRDHVWLPQMARGHLQRRKWSPLPQMVPSFRRSLASIVEGPSKALCISKGMLKAVYLPLSSYLATKLPCIIAFFTDHVADIAIAHWFMLISGLYPFQRIHAYTYLVSYTIHHAVPKTVPI